MTMPQPLFSPITPLASIAETLECDHQPHDASRGPIPFPLRVTPSRRISLPWGSLRYDVVRRLVYSLDCIFNGSLKIDKVLDQMVPDVQTQFSLKMSRVQEPAKTHSAKPMDDLMENAGRLRHLRALGYHIPRLADAFAGNAVSSDGDNGLFVRSRLEELNQWFVSTVNSVDDANMIHLLAYCHDLAILTSEMLQQEPNIVDHSLYLGLTQGYEKERQYLADAYGKGIRAFSGRPRTSAVSSQEHNNLPPLNQYFTRSTIRSPLPRIGTLYEDRNGSLTITAITDRRVMQRYQYNLG